MTNALQKRQKRMGNKGFSLVELIIVIAIMAVLIAVLAPQFIKYVEQSRVSKDESAADEVLRAVQTSIAEDKVYTALLTETSPVTVTVADNGSPTTSVSALQDAVRAIVPGPIDFVSKAHNTDTYTVTITIPAGGGAITVTGPTKDANGAWD